MAVKAAGEITLAKVIDGKDGESGIILSATAPENPKIGQLWQTASGEPIKRWNGQSWTTYYISTDNLDVKNLSAISAILGIFEDLLVDVPGGTALASGSVSVENGIVEGSWEGTGDSESATYSNGYFTLRPDRVSGTIRKVGMGQYSFEIGFNGIKFANNALTLELTIDDIQNLKAAFSTTRERQTIDTWINDKPIYRKTINVGAITSGSQKVVNHGISDVDEIWVDLSNSFLKAGDGNTYTLPRVTSAALNQMIEVVVSKSQIFVTPGSNGSFSGCYVTVRYTKTTD